MCSIAGLADQGHEDRIEVIGGSYVALVICFEKGDVLQHGPVVVLEK